MKDILESGNEGIDEVVTRADGHDGELPISGDDLTKGTSGDLFGWMQNVGMGWQTAGWGKKEILILSTQGGIRQPDGTPTALGYHSGHWEVGLLMEEVAKEVARLDGVPFAGFCSDPCDGRTQGTSGMMDSLPFRNDAAMVLRRLIRSLPTAKGVVGVATCDKGLPAMMMALAGCGHLPGVLVPGGVSLLSEETEDLGKVQSLGARYSHGEVSLGEAAATACRACASPGGGCQFLGTAASSQVMGEALGMSLPHSALSPSGAQIWRDLATRSGRAAMHLADEKITLSKILTEASVKNAMIMHAAFGGSTNLILHLPALAHAAGLPRPTVKEWQEANKLVPRIVDALPNGPQGYATVQVFLAGGVPEAMLKVREFLDLNVLTVSGQTLDENLEWWEKSERRKLVRERLFEIDGIDPDQVIRSIEDGLPSTVTFPVGNLAPEGSVVKSTAIDPTMIDENGIYLIEGRARVFGSEAAAITAVKSQGDDRIRVKDIMILAGIGPMGAGMPETYQVTSALKYCDVGKEVALVTDGRFSGVSTGACIGHVSPEALAGGPIGKLRDGDPVRVWVDTKTLEGRIDYLGDVSELEKRELHPSVKVHPDLPDDTRIWAALQNASGGSWGGCVYDAESITKSI
ncbi:YjhG/YagF family D-xylonate dehydratase [Akkermansiaceae bacterium]|nr:YjhG/YagF family D-xylonate dehydratase [Akkermansiaceae bacterium]